MSKFKINDIFWTLQGEGTYSGRAALFVRLPQCNLDCSWCDTEFNSYKEYTLDQLNSKLDENKNIKFAVLTGGEPLMNSQLKPIIALLKERDFYISCETNGTFPRVAGIDWVTCSPKRDAAYKIHKYLFPDEVKYVVDNGFDFSILTRHEKDFDLKLFVSPEYNEMNKNIEKINTFLQLNPNWRLSLQTHKWIGIK